MSLLSIEKTRKECFVLVTRVSCFGVIGKILYHIDMNIMNLKKKFDENTNRNEQIAKKFKK